MCWLVCEESGFAMAEVLTCLLSQLLRLYITLIKNRRLWENEKRLKTKGRITGCLSGSNAGKGNEWMFVYAKDQAWKDVLKAGKKNQPVSA